MYTPARTLKTTNPKVIRTLDIYHKQPYLVLGQGGTKGQPSLTVWSLDNLKLVSEITSQPSELMLAARVSPDDQTLAYTYSTAPVHLYNLKTGKDQVLAQDNEDVDWLMYSANGKRLVLCGIHTQVWDTSKNTLVWQLDSTSKLAAPHPVGALNEEGKLLAVAGAEAGQVVIYNVDTGKVVQTLSDGPGKTARAVGYDSQERFLAMIDGNGDGVFVWDLKTGKRHLPDIFNEDLTGYWCMRFHPDGKHLALGMLSGYVIVARLSDGDFVVDNRIHKGRVFDLAFTSDGKYFVSGGEDGIAHIWELE